MKTLKPIIKAIRGAGFSHLKVELEAQLNRGRSDERWTEENCDVCNATGREQCTVCSATGAIRETRFGELRSSECQGCMGEGGATCSHCAGDGVIRTRIGGNWGSEDYCRDFILSSVSEEAKASLNYSRFYYDGSVDSEMTFTLPVEKAEYIVEFVNAFNALAEAVGNGMDVDGAGMHIAVLADGCDGRYPVPSSISLDHNGLLNFQEEVTKLLPAMFLAASGGKYSRPLRYRYPQISSNKYSAIHALNGCLEYRLFETCYDRPDAIYEFLGMIAKTLEFYKNPNKRIVRQNKPYPFYSKTGTKKFVETPEQIRIIKKQLRYVLPSGITVKEFEVSRGVRLSVVEAEREQAKKVNEIKVLFQEYAKAYRTAIERPLTRSEESRLAELRESARLRGIGASDMQLRAAAIGLASPVVDERQFIRNNMPRTNRSEVTITT